MVVGPRDCPYRGRYASLETYRCCGGIVTRPIPALDDVRFWHEPDHQRCPQFGRYRGDSGHGGYERRLPSLTHCRQQDSAWRRRAARAAKAIVDLTQWAKPGGEGDSGTDRGATQRGRGTGRRIGRANECANEEDGAPREVTARRAPPRWMWSLQTSRSPTRGFAVDLSSKPKDGI